MSKTVLIVENDAALARAMKEKLSTKGYVVSETNDGKGAAELIRKTKPSAVVLAVDLSAGQNGYIICKKLKSDDELKTVPVIIIGNPDGFVPHKKLKTHADEYLGKPFEPSAIVERISGMIGEPAPDEEVSVSAPDDSNTSEETVGGGDPDFDMVDAMFDDKSAPKAPVEEELKSAEFQVEEDVPPPPPEDQPTQFMKLPTPAASAPTAAKSSAGDAGELRSLKTKVTELTGDLKDAKSRSEELEEKVRALESQLESKQAEVDASKAAGGKTDTKDLFALKDQVNKKDKEILRLKNELNEKEKEVVELHEKETALEQQMSETSGEVARRDAQIKTLTTKSEQLSAERKKIDGQMMSAKEESRAAGAKLTTLQAEFETLTERSTAMETELTTLRASSGEAESARQAAEASLSELKGEQEALKSQAEDRAKETEEIRGQMEQAQIDLDSAKNQLTTQATAFAEEVGGLRKRVTELEDSASKNEAKVKSLSARIKTEESVRERTREALHQALATLDEQPNSDEVLADDDVAEA